MDDEYKYNYDPQEQSKEDAYERRRLFKGGRKIKTNKGNMLHKDTLCGEPEPDCSQCDDEPIHCLRGLERMQEKAERWDLTKDKEATNGHS